MKWEPIKSAPLDRDVVLLADGAMVVGQYARKQGRDCMPFDWTDGVRWYGTMCSPFADFLPAIRNPTHWLDGVPEIPT